MMVPYVALLRAVNVGGTGRVATPALRDVAKACGFGGIGVYIASGNLVFTSDKDGESVKALLSEALAGAVGRPIRVFLRTGDEMAAILSANPFASRPANRTVAIFLDDAPPGDLERAATGRTCEEIAFGRREIYVHYGEAMARSRLKIAGADRGTARNMNTVAALAQMAAARTALG